MTYDDLVLVRCVWETHDVVLCYSQYFSAIDWIIILAALLFVAYMIKYMIDGRDKYGGGTSA